MHGKLILYIDQYGDREWAHTLKELRTKCGGGRVSKMYVDKIQGRTIHCGYVVGQRWFNAYIPFEGRA